MGGTRSAGNATAPGPRAAPEVGSPEWARANAPDWLVDGLAAARVPADIGKMTRRLNKGIDNNEFGSGTAYSIGVAKDLIEQRREELATGRAPMTSPDQARADRILSTTDWRGRRVARTWGT